MINRKKGNMKERKEEWRKNEKKGFSKKKIIIERNTNIDNAHRLLVLHTKLSDINSEIFENFE